MLVVEKLESRPREDRVSPDKKVLRIIKTIASTPELTYNPTKNRRLLEERGERLVAAEQAASSIVSLYKDLTLNKMEIESERHFDQISQKRNK